MADKRSVRLDDPDLNQQLAALLLRHRVPFAAGKDGTLRYSARFDELVDSEILSPLRSRVFARWQVLTFPTEWATVYRDYMCRNKIPFVPEWINGQLVYLLPASYRPHTWNLPDPASKAAPPAAAYATR